MQTLGDVLPHFDSDTASSTGPKGFRSAREYAYTVVRDLIAGMFVAPGALLTEKSVAELLKVSATPVREAFVKLREDGLLVVYPQRGTYVSKINLKKTTDARLVRKVLERELMSTLPVPVAPSIAMEMRQLLEKQEFCIRRADRPEAPTEFVKLDNAFHRLLFLGADQENVWDMIQQFSLHSDRLRILFFKTHRVWDTLLEQHRDILRVVAGEGGAPMTLMEAWRTHFKSIEINYDRVVADNPEYFV